MYFMSLFCSQLQALSLTNKKLMNTDDPLDAKIFFMHYTRKWFVQLMASSTGDFSIA